MFENKLVNIVDKLAPFKELSISKLNNREESTAMKRLINIKRRKLKVWRRTGSAVDCAELKNVNKNIRHQPYF